ncbi:MAG: UbiD family decarboxylase [Nitrososphaerota archaeon]|nr:UbiD family decarboxylase [Nitrososphaerota archaeon]
MYKDEGLRSIIKSKEVLKIKNKVSTRLEITKYLMNYKCPILFENIEGYEGFKIIGNLCSSRELIAKFLGVSIENLLMHLINALNRPSLYQIVDDAEFLKNKVEEPNVIKHIPLVMYYSWKKRYYTSATIILARDPDTNRQNASFHRMMYLKDNRFVVRLVERDLYSFYMKNKSVGKDTKVVVICGVNPAIALAAATSRPNLNELELANTLLNGRLKCISLEGIDVPIESEVVMVGRILHNEVAKEGPFVDLTSTWDKIREQPVLEVERLYMRNDPIWQVILPGGSEHRLLQGIPQEPRIFQIVQNAVPTVKNVVLTNGGCNWLHAVISIKKLSEGDGKNAGLAALAAHPSLKRVIVVDEDINIMDPEDVEWALATRLQPDKGIVFIPNARGSSLDPSSGKSAITTKWIIDATIPLDRDKKDFMKVKS